MLPVTKPRAIKRSIGRLTMNMKTTQRCVAVVLSSVALLFTASQLPARAANADLVVQKLSIYPNPVKVAHEFVIDFDVLNKGPGSAAASRAEWTISGNPSMTFHCSVPALAANRSHHCSWTWLSAPDRPANYGTRAVADCDHVVSEGAAGERNNEITLVLKVQR
jgi:hypothetical protein